ncbi:MAG TPA: MFS transporter [Solirubrobacteraceae bacterium]|nr:MFS transporter [Solirubrobacteraceae bacterium]
MSVGLASAQRLPPWLRVAGVVFGVAWGANQFSPLLLAYKLHAGLSQSTGDALFGVYALGLIPALLVLGPISDARGRRAIVAGAGLLSVVASVALIAGEHTLALLYVGRFLAGVCSGAAFAAGTAHIKELSVSPYDPLASEQAGARRAAVALSAGFGLGALVGGLVAQWAPDPLVTAYVPHLIVMAATLPLLPAAPETVADRGSIPSLAAMLRVPSAGHVRFARIVAPAAPWVFAAPSISFAVLPILVADQTGSFGVGFAAVIAGLTLGLGITIQPLARRLDSVQSVRGMLVALAAICAGTLVGALAGATHSWPLVVPAGVLLGGGYGICIVSGLLEIQRIAHRDDLASLTAVFYALTYVGFAAPIVLTELERFASAPLLLVCTAGVVALTAAEVWQEGAATSRQKQR